MQKVPVTIRIDAVYKQKLILVRIQVSQPVEIAREMVISSVDSSSGLTVGLRSARARLRYSQHRSVVRPASRIGSTSRRNGRLSISAIGAPAMNRRVTAEPRKSRDVEVAGLPTLPEPSSPSRQWLDRMRRWCAAFSLRRISRPRRSVRNSLSDAYLRDGRRGATARATDRNRGHVERIGRIVFRQRRLKRAAVHP